MRSGCNTVSDIKANLCVDIIIYEPAWGFNKIISNLWDRALQKTNLVSNSLASQTAFFRFYLWGRKFLKEAGPRDYVSKCEKPKCHLWGWLNICQVPGSLTPQDIA